MARFIRLVVGIVSLVVAVLFGLHQPAEASVGQSPVVAPVDYIHDNPAQYERTSHATSERGPPAPDDNTTTYDPDGLRPLGPLARPDAPAPSRAIAYDYPALLVQVAHPSGATWTGAGGNVGESSPRERSRVAAKTADDWPILSGIVRDAAKGKGNFGLGSGSASQATRAGESWVGEGYRIASDGKTLVSRDGLKTFRPPTWKPNEGKYQANFEYWIGERVGKPFGNGHLDIAGMGP